MGGFGAISSNHNKKYLFPYRSDLTHETDNAKGFLWTVLHKMCNVNLMLDPKFFLVGLNTFFGILGLYIPYVYLPSLARDNIPGLSVNKAGLLISIIGKI